MIMQYIDRRRPTQGGLALSFAIHGGLILLLAIMVGQQVASEVDWEELTEIAYIEARYGEDVAARPEEPLHIRWRPALRRGA